MSTPVIQPMTSFPKYDMNEFRSISADMKPSQVLPDSLVIPGILKGARRKARWSPKIREVCEALKVKYASDIYYVCTIVQVQRKNDLDKRSAILKLRVQYEDGTQATVPFSSCRPRRGHGQENIFRSCTLL